MSNTSRPGERRGETIQRRSKTHLFTVIMRRSVDKFSFHTTDTSSRNFDVSSDVVIRHGFQTRAFPDFHTEARVVVVRFSDDTAVTEIHSTELK